MRTSVYNIIWIVAFALAFVNCSDSDFAGSSSRSGSQDDSDAEDASDEPGDRSDAQTADVGDVADAGDGGDGDAGDLGADGDGDSGGDSDSTDEGIGTDSEEQSKKTLHAMIVKRTREDFDDLKVKISLLSKDEEEEVLTKTIDVPLNEDVIIEKGCRTNSRTVIRVEFQGDSVIKAGDKCFFEQIVSDTELKVDVDTEEFLDGIFGGCKPGEDDTVTFSCPDTKVLEIIKF